MAITDITNLTGLNIQPETDLNGNIPFSALHAVYIPSLTTAQITTLLTKAETRNGLVVYDNTLNVYKVRQNGVINILGSSISAVTGAGLVTGSPLIVPSGADAAVEVVGNQVNGFIYYGATSTTIRARVNGAWVSIATV